jgi:hypothetical protein
LVPSVGEGPGILVIPGFFVAGSGLPGIGRRPVGYPVGYPGRVVVEFISALVHRVSRKNRNSSLTAIRVADAGLTSRKPAGNFEKLLRSDP